MPRPTVPRLHRQILTSTSKSFGADWNIESNGDRCGPFYSSSSGNDIHRQGKRSSCYLRREIHGLMINIREGIFPADGDMSRRYLASSRLSRCFWRLKSTLRPPIANQRMGMLQSTTKQTRVSAPFSLFPPNLLHPLIFRPFPSCCPSAPTTDRYSSFIANYEIVTSL